MTDTIEIAPDAVLSAARSITLSGRLVAGAARMLRSVPQLSSDSEVAQAFTEFRAGWSRALAVITDDVTACGSAISAALDEWEAMDRRLAAAGGGRRIVPCAS